MLDQVTVTLAARLRKSALRLGTPLTLMAAVSAGCANQDKASTTTTRTTKTETSLASGTTANTAQASAAQQRNATAGGDGTVRREGDRTKVTMLYPTGEKTGSVLRVEKNVPSQVRVGQPFQYDVTVTNVTEATVDDVRIQEDPGEGLEITGSEPSITGEGDEAGWAIGNLKAGESKTVRVNGVAQQVGQVGSCLFASYRPSLCTVLNVVNPQIRVTKTAPDVVDICEPIVFEYTVTNSGTGQTEPVTVRETLPEGLTTEDGKNVVALDAGRLDAGATRKGAVRLKAAKAGTYQGRAIASSQGGLEAQTGNTTTRIVQPRLGIRIEGPDAEYVNRPIGYRVTVTNEGDTAARNTIASVALPPNANVLAAGNEGRNDRGTISWNLGTLEPRATRTVTFTLRSNEEATLAPTASAKAQCATNVDASLQTRVLTIPALVLEVVDLADPIRVGENVTYRLRVMNQGSGADNQIALTAELPKELQYVSSKGVTQGTAQGQVVKFAPVATLAPGEIASWELVAKALTKGDVRFEVQLQSEALTKPAYENEPTQLFDQAGANIKSDSDVGTDLGTNRAATGGTPRTSTQGGTGTTGTGGATTTTETQTTTTEKQQGTNNSK